MNKRAFRILWILVGVIAVAAIAVSAWFVRVNETNGEIASSGETRRYLLHVPDSYDPAKPAPLVISLHAYALTPALQMRISRWNALADELGFIVVYPAGTRFPKLWRAKKDDGSRDDVDLDVAFISDLIDELQRKYNIDAARIYANGFSNGGGMSHALYCRLGNRIAAIGMVSSAILMSWDLCNATRPMPLIMFHGTKDPITFYSGGHSGLFNVDFPSVPDWIREFARRDACAETPRESVVSAEVMRTEYSGCAGNAEVLLYSVEGGGHTWPGGRPVRFVGHTTDDIDATEAMWDFFRAHPLPRDP
jgi:polyhydroxybutyrate depolymerase